MKDLSDTISELLYEYDCVIIPELGGFITNYRPASINEDSGVLFPPSKALSFNGNLVQNDGLIANHIAANNNISFEKACDQIKQKVEDCFSNLNEGHRVCFEKVGILYLDEENSIQFEPDESVNYLASSFGLIEFHYPELREIESEVVQEEPALIKEQVGETPVIALPRKELEKVIERVKEEPVVRKITSGSRYRYWAAAALLPLLFYMGLVVWQSDVIKDGNIHKSELNPFKMLKKPVYKERSKVFEGLEIPVIEHIRLPEDGLKGELEVEDDVMLPVIEETNSGSTFEEAVSRSEKAEPAVLNEPETKLEMKEKVVITATTIIADELFARPEMVSLPYHVMNGCYGVISNAKKQTKRLRGRGYDAAILDKKGKLYRVSQGSFTSEEEAINLLKKAKREDDPSAWLLKK